MKLIEENGTSSESSDQDSDESSHDSDASSDLYSDDKEHNSDEEADPEDFSSDSHFPKTFKIKDEQAVSLDNTYVLHISAYFGNNKIKLVAGLSDYQCVLYDIEQGFHKGITQQIHDDIITDIKLVDENLFYSSSQDGTIKLWDLRDMKNPSSVFSDDTDGEDQLKPINCFGLSCDGKFIGAGTNVVDADAYVLFWDCRNPKVLGGYWETHTDDVTSIEFHPNKANTMLSGSTDGLINLFDISAPNEDDALQNSFNVESSIRKLKWVNIKNEDRIGCITDMETIQFWNTEDSSPYLNFSRKILGSTMYIRSSDNAYIADIHQPCFEENSEIVILGGSNVQKGEYIKSVALNDDNLKPFSTFVENKQIVRCSCYKNDVFITAGESGIISVWEETDEYVNKVQLKERTKKFKPSN